jgi:hypothetical protein
MSLCTDGTKVTEGLFIEILFGPSITSLCTDGTKVAEGLFIEILFGPSIKISTT